MGLLRDIFLSKEDKKVIDIYNALEEFWKYNNDFILGHQRYLVSINNQYNLGFTDQLVESLPMNVLSPLSVDGLSKWNSMFIFAQFMVYYVFRFNNPKIYRYSDENLLWLSEHILEILIPYNSKVTPEFTRQIDKGYDVLGMFGNKNISTKNDERQKSINLLSQSMGCEPSQLRQEIFSQLQSMDTTIEACKILIKNKFDTRFAESERYNIKPDNTPSAIMLEFIEEYIVLLKDEGNQDDSVFHEMTKYNSELMSQLLTAQASGNMSEFNEILSSNPNFFNSFMQKMAENEEKPQKEENPASQCLEKAFDLFYDEENPDEAMKYINEGLDYNQKLYNPPLLELKAEIFQKQNDTKNAIKFFDLAYDSYDSDDPSEYFYISRVLKRRSEVKLKEKDNDGASADSYLSTIYYDKYIANLKDGERPLPL